MGRLTGGRRATDGRCRGLVRWQPVPGAGLRLFCLPHAGGGATTYRHWAQLLAPDIEVIAIRLPGRESRLGEPPLRTIPDIVTALVTDVAPWLDRPYAWFGHSFGALIAYETCRALRQARLPAPVRLFVSGRRAPHIPSPRSPIHRASLPEFLGRLQELNGTSPEFAEDEAALASLLPMLRADFTAVETYTYQPGPPLGCPISVFSGLDDGFVASAGLHAWQEHTSASCHVRLFRGGHFFLHESPGPLLSQIASELSGIS